VDLLIEQGRSEYDFEKRRSIYHDIHRIMVEDAASIFLFARRLYTGATSRIEGLDGQPQLLFKSVRDWKITAQNQTRR
jgi:ABC-type transport system substrate-binding protein